MPSRTEYGTGSVSQLLDTLLHHSGKLRDMTRSSAAAPTQACPVYQPRGSAPIMFECLTVVAYLGCDPASASVTRKKYEPWKHRCEHKTLAYPVEANSDFCYGRQGLPGCSRCPSFGTIRSWEPPRSFLFQLWWEMQSGTEYLRGVPLKWDSSWIRCSDYFAACKG